MLDFSSAAWLVVLQWAYALFQALIRNSKGFNLVYYYLQWLLFRDKNRTTIIWVNKDYISKSYKDLGSEWFEDDCEAWPRNNLLNRESYNGISFLDHKHYWYKIKLNGKFYWIHQDTVGELYHYNFDQCYFVKDLYDLSSRYSVGQRITQEEALLLLFNMDMHFYEIDTKTVIHGRELNIEFNSKLGALLAVVPLLLQARGWIALSALASAILLIVDVLRTPLYNFYDWAFFHITKFVKLRVFKQRSWLYVAFGFLSDRWLYSNYEKRYAYETHANEEVEVTSYVSYPRDGQCDLVQVWGHELIDPDTPPYIIRDGVISLGSYNYGTCTASIRVQEGLYFS